MKNRVLAILDVGHGNSSVLRDDNGVVVIDTGLGTTLLEFLKDVGIRQLDVVLISHADADHISGLIQLLACREFVVKKVRLNTDSAKKSQLWDNLLYELNSLDKAGKVDWEVSLTANQQEDYSQGRVRIEVLGPSKYLAAKGAGSKDDQGRKITTNSISCVIRFSQGDLPLAVFPGDIDEVGLDDLQRDNGKTGARILVFPHHGGHSGSSDMGVFTRKICDQFEPSVVVFSIGRGLHSTPRTDVVLAIRRHVKDVRIACTQLSENCTAADPVEHLGHLDNAVAFGKGVGACCAGTLVLDLDNISELTPDPAQHALFIEKVAPDALCRRAIV